MRRLAEWLDIKLDSLSADDKIGLISEVMETLTAQELRRVRDTAESKSQEKFEDAKNAVLEEMRGKLAELGLTMDDVLSAPASMRKTRKGTGGTVRVKYRGPQDETWSGRGQAPQWIKHLEEQGHTREEFLVQSDER